MPESHGVNACLPTGDMAADPHGIVASRPTCSGARAHAGHLRPLLSEANQPSPWAISSSPMGSISYQMLVTLQSLSSSDLLPALKTSEPATNWPSALGYDTDPSRAACPKPTPPSPCPDSSLHSQSPPQGQWHHRISHNPSQNPRNQP